MNVIPIQNDKLIQLLFIYSKPLAFSTTCGMELLSITCSLDFYSLIDIPSAQISQINVSFTKTSLPQV